MSLTIEAAIALRDTLSENTGYRFDPHAGLVILRQTFVRRRHRWQFDALSDRRHGGGRVAEWFKAAVLKFVGGRFGPFRSVLTSVDLYCENRPRVPIRPVQYRPVVPSSRPFW